MGACHPSGILRPIVVEANVRAVRTLYESWKRGDFSVGADLYDPSIELEIKELPDSREARGTAELSDAWRDHLSHWHGWRTGPIEELIARGERVVAITRVQGRGKHSGIDVEMLAAGVFTFRDGRILRLQLVNDRARALEAAGLAEPPAIELIRRSYDAFNRGDYEEAIALTPLDYELHIAQDGVGVGAGIEEVYRGHEGLHDAVEDFVSPFESLRYKPHELIDLGDRVVVLLHMIARGGGSGAETEQTLGIVYEVEDGVPVRERHFWEWQNALESVGLAD